jgi:hypothetical protein
MSHDERLQAQKERAMTLHDAHCCPHCLAPLSRIDILSLAQGDGYITHVRIERPDGSRMVMRNQEVNPQTMLMVDE